LAVIKYVSVTQLTQALKQLIEESINLEGVWIRGEVSNFSRAASGHLYFTLKDEGAQLKCVMFRGQTHTLKFDPADGQAVSIQGRLSIYEKSGQYQLYVNEMAPDGIGNLYQAFEALKEKLAMEGLFATERKRSLPPLPQRIALITSPTSAAVQDMIKVLQRRRPNLEIFIVPALVQGKEAPASLIQALELASRLPKLDLAIIGRGGGSLEELWAFNDEQLARAIAAFPRPIISAVGHETDVTIADFVADLRAPTPSAAAELAVPDQNAWTQGLNQLRQRLQHAVQRLIQQYRRELERLGQSRVFLLPRDPLLRHRQELDQLMAGLTRPLRQQLLLERERFGRSLGKLDTLSPLATLQRGYAVVRKIDGTVIRSTVQTELGEEIRLLLAAGILCCEVKAKENVNE
jgi:exodeoxyribonuclease VII large subunit